MNYSQEDLQAFYTQERIQRLLEAYQRGECQHVRTIKLNGVCRCARCKERVK